MKKTLLSFAAVISFTVISFLFSTQQAAAQYESLGINVGMGLPMGNFGDAATAGFGGSASGRYFFNDNFALGLNIGYTKFSAKTTEGVSGVSESVMPICGTAEFFVGDKKLKPYFAEDMGVALLSSSVTVSIPGAPSETVSASATGFYIAEAVGIKYDISSNLDFLFNIKYNIFSKDGAAAYLGVNAGLSYSFGKSNP